MAYFVVYALDRPGQDAVRETERPAHRVRLREHDHALKVLIGGPLTDDGGRMIGSMLVIEAEKKATVEAYLAGDPYMLGGLYETVAIHPFAWGLGRPEEPSRG